MKPVMNSRRMMLTKELFVDKKDLKKTDRNCINKNHDDTNHGKLECCGHHKTVGHNCVTVAIKNFILHKSITLIECCM